VSQRSLLYTMTTIAESLGSAMALLAAFALYRLQALSSYLQTDSMHLNDTAKQFCTPKDLERLTWLAASENWKEYLFEIKRVHDGRPANWDIGPSMRARLVRLPFHYETYCDVSLALWVALALTAIVITGAVVTLADSDCLSGRVAWFGVIGLILCLLSYLRLIYVSLKSPARTP
jgi:hypothetical protein